MTGRCFGGCATSGGGLAAEAAQDHVEERAVHRLAHDVRQDGARAADQRAGDDQHAVVQREADAGRGPARIAVEHRHHHRHVGAADRDDDQHTHDEGQRQHREEGGPALGGHEQQAQADGGQAQDQVELVLPGKLHRRALEQPELVFARELAEGDHRAAEGDGADGRAQEQLEPVAGRDRQALGHDAERVGLGHGRNRDEHRRQADHAVEERHQFGHLRHLDRLGAVGAIGAAGQQADQHPDHAHAEVVGQVADQEYADWDIIENEYSDFFEFMRNQVLPEMKEWITDNEIDEY